MPDAQEPVDDRLLQLLEGVRLPAAVEAAWTSKPLVATPGQFWRTEHDQVARLVLVLRAEGDRVDIAPITLDPELTTDEAFIAEADLTDLQVPVAVWLPLRRAVSRKLLDRHIGDLHVPVDAIRRFPTGRPLLSPLEDRAMERAELEDDMDELSASAAADSLDDLLVNVSLPQLQAAGFPLPLVLQLRRGLRALSEEEAERLAPLAGVTPARLLTANPALPERLLRDLDSAVGRAFVEQYQRARGGDPEVARLSVGYGAYALAARETEKGDIDWLARIKRYVQVVLGGH